MAQKLHSTCNIDENPFEISHQPRVTLPWQAFGLDKCILQQQVTQPACMRMRQALQHVLLHTNCNQT
jgi:hypothetical protein